MGKRRLAPLAKTKKVAQCSTSCMMMCELTHLDILSENGLGLLETTKTHQRSARNKGISK
jgi:hypothetical protein